MNVPTVRHKQVRQHHASPLANVKTKAKQRKRVAKGSSRILVQQKRRQALEMRKAGATYQIIADQVGYADAGGARKAVLKAFGEVIQEPVQELKTLQVERLNHMLLVLWPKVQQGDTSAMNTALSIMNKIDSLMGTDAATQIEVRNDTAVLVVEGDKNDYIAALKKMSGAGIGPDGKNLTAVQVPDPKGLPSPTGVMSHYPPGMGQSDLDASTPPGDMLVEDIVDAEVVGEAKMSDCPSPLGTVCMDPTCRLHFPNAAPAMETKKKFKFGVDPTVKR